MNEKSSAVRYQMLFFKMNSYLNLSHFCYVSGKGLHIIQSMSSVPIRLTAQPTKDLFTIFDTFVITDHAHLDHVMERCQTSLNLLSLQILKSFSCRTMKGPNREIHMNFGWQV